LLSKVNPTQTWSMTELSVDVEREYSALPLKNGEKLSSDDSVLVSCVLSTVTPRISSIPEATTIPTKSNIQATIC
jgi:hypothetical protein